MRTGSKARELTSKSSGRRSTVRRLTYQSPSAVSDSHDAAFGSGRAAASFCVRRSATMRGDGRTTLRGAPPWPRLLWLPAGDLRERAQGVVDGCRIRKRLRDIGVERHDSNV